MKYYDAKEDTVKKVSLIDDLSANMSYNMAAKERPWSDLSINLRLKLTKSYTFNTVSYTHLDVYKRQAIDSLRLIQKASKMTFSARQASYFGRILQRLGVKSRRKTYGTYYHVVPLEVK